MQISASGKILSVMNCHFWIDQGVDGCIGKVKKRTNVQYIETWGQRIKIIMHGERRNSILQNDTNKAYAEENGEML